MRVIELDAREWTTVLDFYNALLTALGAPEWHGRNANALMDSMIWGGINSTNAPYTVRIVGATKLPPEIRDEIDLIAKALVISRAEYQRRRGADVDVTLYMEN